MKTENNFLNLLYYLFFQILNGKSMLAALGLDTNSLKSGLLHLVGQPNIQKGRSAKVKDGIISETKFLGTFSVYRYMSFLQPTHSASNVGGFLQGILKGEVSLYC